MREDLEKLGRLQELDLKIDRAKKIMASAPLAFKNLEDQIFQERSALSQAETLKADLESQKRNLETEILMDKDRIKNIESRLGNVTNNKEYHAASKEAEKAKKLISDREKTVLELIEKIATQEKLASEIGARLEAYNSQLSEKKTEIGTQMGEADKEIASYSGDRSAIVAEIKPPLMSRYTRIRTVYSDAIVAARSGHCSSCNVSLPPQLYIQVQKGLELVTCPSCQRLLYHQIQ